MRKVYLTSKENYMKINEKDGKFGKILSGEYKGNPLFFSNSEMEESLIREIQETEEVEIVRI